MYQHRSAAAFVPTSALQRFGIRIGFFLLRASGRLDRKPPVQKPFHPRDSTLNFPVEFAFSFMACFGAQTLQGLSLQTADAQNPLSAHRRDTDRSAMRRNQQTEHQHRDEERASKQIYGLCPGR